MDIEVRCRNLRIGYEVTFDSCGKQIIRLSVARLGRAQAGLAIDLGHRLLRFLDGFCRWFVFFLDQVMEQLLDGLLGWLALLR